MDCRVCWLPEISARSATATSDSVKQPALEDFFVVGEMLEKQQTWLEPCWCHTPVARHLCSFLCPPTWSTSLSPQGPELPADKARFKAEQASSLQSDEMWRALKVSA